jgi:hypothetical protein
MKRVYVARLIGSKGRIWVVFDETNTVRGTTDLSKLEVLEKWKELHGPFTHVTVYAGAHQASVLAMTMADLRHPRPAKPTQENQ